ncbi:MAG: RIP metalloprotease RseP [Gemmatimonadetes bacterium RBG_16_66_8]|nr:MAG: RIP metalloprotease RseP [Gemmatimonadetes bacterium RBG_16_66_8]
MLLTIAAAVVVLGVVIFVHELGHFIAAKAAGVGVIRFSIGFGPATPLRVQRGDTEYVLSWFPLGGYVMMASDEESEVDEASGAAKLEGGAEPRRFPPDQLFEHKPLWARCVVLSAGVAMNVLFAWVIYVSLAAAYGRREDPTTTVAAVDTTVLPAAARAWAGVPVPARLVRINGDTVTSWSSMQEHVLDPTVRELRFEIAGVAQPVTVAVGSQGDQEDRVRLLRALEPRWEPRLGDVPAGRPAARAGLRRGDLIVMADGDTVTHWQQLVGVVEAHPEDSVLLGVVRDGTRLTLAVVPAAEEQEDGTPGMRRVVGRIGVGVETPVRRVHFGLIASLREGLRRTSADAGLVIFAVKGLVFGDVSPRELGGPIFVGQLSGQLARVGLEPFLAFVALFSVNLAVLNLLPIPVLDGGRLVFLVLEGLLRRPLPRAWRVRLSQVGVAFLLAVMLLALANDILRLVGG